MVSINDFKKLSFLVYGLGITGQSVVKFFKKNNIKKYYLYDDKFKKNKNLDAILKEVDFIVLSPGISLKTSKNISPILCYASSLYLSRRIE